MRACFFAVTKEDPITRPGCDWVSNAVPSSPDGSKWERNVPPAAGVCRMKAHEYEWYYGVPPPKDYQCAPDHDAHH
jgi:hypothetical protein